MKGSVNAQQFNRNESCTVNAMGRGPQPGQRNVQGWQACTSQLSAGTGHYLPFSQAK
jgi:hypothetical protein